MPLSISEALAYKLPQSYTYRCFKVLWEKTRMLGHTSLFIELVKGERGEGTIQFLAGSRVVAWLLGNKQAWRKESLSSAGNCQFTNAAGRLIRDFFRLPLQVCSILLITIICTNTLFTVLLHKPVFFSAWLLRLILLVLCAAGVFCSASWDELQKTSLILRITQAKARL